MDQTRDQSSGMLFTDTVSNEGRERGRGMRERKLSDEFVKSNLSFFGKSDQ